jgi:hypothetical protein
MDVFHEDAGGQSTAETNLLVAVAHHHGTGPEYLGRIHNRTFPDAESDALRTRGIIRDLQDPYWTATLGVQQGHVLSSTSEASHPRGKTPR